MVNQEIPLHHGKEFFPNVRVEIPLNQVTKFRAYPIGGGGGGGSRKDHRKTGAGRPVHEGFYQLEALLRALNVASQVPLPTYCGIDHENPNIFIAECEQCEKCENVNHLLANSKRCSH